MSEVNGGDIFLIVGPSATGKTTLAQRLRDELEMIEAVSHTTRPIRPGEVEGETYYYVGEDLFQAKADNNEFVECITYPGNGSRYGITKEEVEGCLLAGDVILVVDGVGASQFQRIYPDRAHVVFLIAPNDEELERRMRERNPDVTDEEIQRRLASVNEEMAWKRIADYSIVPCSKDEMFETAKIWVETERRRRKYGLTELKHQFKDIVRRINEIQDPLEKNEVAHDLEAHAMSMNTLATRLADESFWKDPEDLIGLLVSADAPEPAGVPGEAH